MVGNSWFFSIGVCNNISVNDVEDSLHATFVSNTFNDISVLTTVIYINVHSPSDLK